MRPLPGRAATARPGRRARRRRRRGRPSCAGTPAAARRATLRCRDGDAVELGLQPVILDTALAVEAQILGDGAVGQFADVLAWRWCAASCAGRRRSVAAPRGASGRRRRRRRRPRVARRTGRRSARRRLRRDRARVREQQTCLNSTAFQPVTDPAPWRPDGEFVVTLDGRGARARRSARCTPTIPLFAAATACSRRCWCATAGRACSDAHLARLVAVGGDHRAARARPRARWRPRSPSRSRGGAPAARRCCGWCYGRGRGRRSPSAFVTVSAVPDRVVAARRDGVAAVTLDRGGPAADRAVVAGRRQVVCRTRRTRRRCGTPRGWCRRRRLRRAPTASCWRGRGRRW